MLNVIQCKWQKQKVYINEEITPPDIKSLRMKFKRVNLVTHSMMNCLNMGYEQLDPTVYRWRRKCDGLQPQCFDGNALPTEQDLSEMPQASDNADTLSSDDIESSEEKGIEGEQQSHANGEESGTDIDSLRAI